MSNLDLSVPVTRVTPLTEASRLLRFLVVAGAAVFVLGLFLSPARIWANMLLAGYYLTGLGLAGLFFLALQHICSAGWSTAFRRVPETMTRVLPISGLLMLGVLIFGGHSLYEWMHEDVMAHDALLQSKAAWLNTPFFLARTVIYFCVWIGFAWALRASSQAQDRDGDVRHTHRAATLSAIFMFAFALTLSAASFDWLMSLEPHWFSTIFGVYNFAGIFFTGLAAMTILVILLKRRGVFGDAVTTDHIHGLGKLVFGFSIFWAYIWISQYILIWYSNIPEETAYFAYRHQGGWFSVSLLSLFINWVVPFLVLLPKPMKKNETVLLRVCALIMVGHWVDLYFMILPPVQGARPLFNIWELFPALGAVALFFLLFERYFKTVNPLPVKDPMLEESRTHCQ